MAYSEDNFPSAAQWATQAYSSYKQWPTSVNPNSVTVIQDRPAFSNYSHNGRKFTRRINTAKWSLQVEYPPLTDAQFLAMHAVALAAQGQYNPFEFDIDYLFQYQSTATATMTVARETVPGNRSIKVGNFAADATGVVKKGEILEVPNQNGGLNIVLADADSDSNGDAEVVLAYPITQTVAAATVLERKLQQVVVTLADNGFNYSKAENGFYQVTVAFDLDEWK